MTDSIAHEAHGLVHGERAKTYGHPRFDFTVIAQVWTGLLADLLKDGAQLDPYRVAILMSGLKLARLVKSPTHKDSRVDTIGYVLTMERLDEPTEEELLRADAAAVADDDLSDVDWVNDRDVHGRPNEQEGREFAMGALPPEGWVKVPATDTEPERYEPPQGHSHKRQEPCVPGCPVFAREIQQVWERAQKSDM